MRFGMSNPRVYWHKKKAVPSVSTVTKIFQNGIPFNWPASKAMEFVKDHGLDPDGIDIEDICDEAVGESERYMNEAAILGTAVHASLDRFFKTRSKTPEPLPAGAFFDDYVYRTMIIRAITWLDKYHVTPALVEAAMSNDRYGGTIDLLCTLDSEAFQTKRWCKTHHLPYPQPHKRVTALLDWKVAASYYEDMPVKLAAYRKMLLDYGYPVEVMLIGRFSKLTGSLNIKDYTDVYSESLKTFDLACELFHHNFKDMLEKLEQEKERQRKARIEKKNSEKETK